MKDVEHHEKQLETVNNKFAEWHKENVREDEEIAKLKTMKKDLEKKVKQRGEEESKANKDKIKEIKARIKKIVVNKELRS